MENNKKSILEAILFACAEPIETEKIASVMEIDNSELEEIIKELEADYEQRQAGFKLIKINKKVQLCSRSEYFPFIKSILELKRNTPLSQAAFEVLAVIAYNQPVTKSLIEQVRGVDCSGVVSTLCEKGLIEEKGRLDLPGRPLLYGTTDDFLRCFSLASIQDLPVLPVEDEGEVDSNIENKQEDIEPTQIDQTFETNELVTPKEV